MSGFSFLLNSFLFHLIHCPYPASLDCAWKLNIWQKNISFFRCFLYDCSCNGKRENSGLGLVWFGFGFLWPNWYDFVLFRDKLPFVWSGHLGKTRDSFHNSLGSKFFSIVCHCHRVSQLVSRFDGFVCWFGYLCWLWPNTSIHHTRRLILTFKKLFWRYKQIELSHCLFPFLFNHPFWVKTELTFNISVIEF